LIVGIFFIPTILDKLKKLLNDETLLIISVGLCLGMVLFSSYLGFSTALGAFIMGSIFAETHQAKQIEHLLDPLKNLFGAIFFISVGMMLVPGTVVEFAIPIVAITIVVILGNLVFATIGITAAGESLKTAIYSGFSLAQIGEFSFIIATLGMQLGVIDPFLYPIIISISVITAFVTPMFMKLSGPTYKKIESLIPLK
jgi:CPA2 family monovalent cation:H+ antiporter-2